MIVTRTPFRVSFAGGGTDLPAFYRKNGYGAVVSAAIQKYIYIVIHPYFQDKIRIKYSRTEDVDNVDDIQHPIVRECLRKVGIERGMEIASFADVASGTGLGSSSSFTVGLLHALYASKGKTVSKERLAAEACEIEIDILKEPIGKQDQYAAAYGGINYIQFNSDETVEVTPILLTDSIQSALEKSLCLYYTGGQRKSTDILKELKVNLDSTQAVFDNQSLILDQVIKIKKAFYKREIQSIGKILDDSWQLKKKLAGEITNTQVDLLFTRARDNGANGGKLLGAGGKGFLLLQHDDHEFLKQKLNSRSLPFKLDRQGTIILFHE